MSFFLHLGVKIDTGELLGDKIPGAGEKAVHATETKSYVQTLSATAWKKT